MSDLSLESRNQVAIELMRNGYHKSAVGILRDLLGDLKDGTSLPIAAELIRSTDTSTRDTKPLVAVTVNCEPNGSGEAMYNRAFMVGSDVSLPCAIVGVCFNYALATHFVAAHSGDTGLFANALLLYKSAHQISMVMDMQQTIVVTPVLAATVFQMSLICAEFYDREKAKSLRSLLASVVRGTTSVFLGSQDCTFYHTNLFFAKYDELRGAAAA